MRLCISTVTRRWNAVISFTLSPTYHISRYLLVKRQVGLKKAVASAVWSIGLKLMFVPVLPIRDDMDTGLHQYNRQNSLPDTLLERCCCFRVTLHSRPPNYPCLRYRISNIPRGQHSLRSRNDAVATERSSADRPSPNFAPPPSSLLLIFPFNHLVFPFTAMIVYPNKDQLLSGLRRRSSLANTASRSTASRSSAWTATGAGRKEEASTAAMPSSPNRNIISGNSV